VIATIHGILDRVNRSLTSIGRHGVARRLRFGGVVSSSLVHGPRSVEAIQLPRENQGWRVDGALIARSGLCRFGRWAPKAPQNAGTAQALLLSATAQSRCAMKRERGAAACDRHGSAFLVLSSVQSFGSFGSSMNGGGRLSSNGNLRSVDGSGVAGCVGVAGCAGAADVPG
jgi:hypothetical protein